MFNAWLKKKKNYLYGSNWEFNFFYFWKKKILFELKIQKGVTFMKAQSCSQNKIKYWLVIYELSIEVLSTRCDKFFTFFFKPIF